MKLNFGAGEDMKTGYDNFDRANFDFNIYPYPIQKNTYSEIYARMVIEHIFDIPKTLKEFHRISKPNAKIIIITSHYTCKGSYEDVEHVHYLTQEALERVIKVQTNGVKFKIKRLYTHPTRVGKFIPKKLREKLALFINGLSGTVVMELEVIKK